MNKSLVKEVLKNVDMIKYKFATGECWNCEFFNFELDRRNATAVLTDGIVETFTDLKLTTETKYNMEVGVYLYKENPNGFKLVGLINNKGVFIYE